MRKQNLQAIPQKESEKKTHPAPSRHQPKAENNTYDPRKGLQNKPREGVEL